MRKLALPILIVPLVAKAPATYIFLKASEAVPKSERLFAPGKIWPKVIIVPEVLILPPESIYKVPLAVVELRPKATLF